MLFRVSLHALCLAAALSVTPIAGICAEPAPPPNPYLGRHVRGTTPKMDLLIEEGMRRSPTFQGLIEALNASDVIVYLEATNDMPKGLDGRLAFMTTAGGVRYLHAQVTSSMTLDELIPIAGHELQHALEVAAHAEVRDGNSLAALYMRIGIPSHVKNRYDTAAAQSTGKRVRAELS